MALGFLCWVFEFSRVGHRRLRPTKFQMGPVQHPTGGTRDHLGRWGIPAYCTCRPISDRAACRPSGMCKGPPAAYYSGRWIMCAGFFLLRASPQVPTSPQKFRYRVAKDLKFWWRSAEHSKTASHCCPSKPKQPNQDTFICHNTSPLHFYPQLRFRDTVKKSRERPRVSPSDIMMNSSRSCFLVKTTRQYFMSPTFTIGLTRAEINDGRAEEPVPTMLAR